MAAEKQGFAEIILATLPKAAPALLVPAVQFFWRQWRDRSGELQKQKLRATIVELNNFLISGGSDTDTHEARQVKDNAIRERNEAVAKLAKLCLTDMAPATGVAEPPQPARSATAHSGLRRCFLLYAPRNAMGWVGHAIFFLSLLALPLSAIGVLSDESDEPATALAVVFAVFACFALLGWAISDLSRIPTVTPLKGFRQGWLLAFRPRGAFEWMVRIVYYPLLILNVLGLIAGVAMLPSDSDAPAVLSGYAVLAPFVLLLRFAALKLAQRGLSVPPATTAHPTGQGTAA